MVKLRRFQERFIRAATSPRVNTAALSLPRGNGKSWLGGHMVARVLHPHDKLFRPGTESVLCAASIEQSRIVFRFAREVLEPIRQENGKRAYRFLDSATRCAITHLPTNTRLRVIGSNGKTAMGLVNCPWAICDEPGAWETNGGQLLHDAIETAKGKPGSPLKVVYIGTLAPATSGWWHEMCKGEIGPRHHVTLLQGDPERWDDWNEIRRCNPLTAVDPAFRVQLLEERDAARKDSRLKARFLSYRLNVPTMDASTTLLTADDWRLVRARPVPEREGAPVVGLDLGGGRAWSAATALWRNGRMEAIAVAPGIPSIEEQEKRDLVPAGTYRRLVDAGRLRTAEGLRVPHPSMLVDWIREEWGLPRAVICDLFRLSELRDTALPCPVLARRARYSDSSFDIRALRKMATDGPLSCTPESEPLVLWSVAAAKVRPDQYGGAELVKRDSANNTGRDDVAAALTLGAGLWTRDPGEVPVYGGLIG